MEHKNGEGEGFYRKLAGRSVRVGVEATGGRRWFERLLHQLKLELWIGDPVKVPGTCSTPDERVPQSLP